MTWYAFQANLSLIKESQKDKMAKGEFSTIWLACQTVKSAPGSLGEGEKDF